MEAYRGGRLKGEVMPEHENPGLPMGSAENYLYFTLPMALNYQRNSYALWRAAHLTYLDGGTRPVFSPEAVSDMDMGELTEKLKKYKVALQPNRHPLIWRTICASITELFGGDVRRLFSECDYSVLEIKRFFSDNKPAFPYLGGEKILNYWLYVIESYTDLSFRDRGRITVAPDTHVIKASVRLGLLTQEQAERPDVRRLAAERWSEVLEGTDIQPIDLHTPLWLWSRGGFAAEI